MGKSAPPRSHVDLVDSYARLHGGQVEVVLAEPDLEVPDGAAVVLRQGDARHVAEHELVEDERGRRLVVRVARDVLGDGIYAVRLRTAEGATSWGCRLLVQGERPLVLLWGGRTPASELPTPHPRGAGAPAPSAPPARRALRRARGLAARARAAGRRRLRG